MEQGRRRKWLNQKTSEKNRETRKNSDEFSVEKRIALTVQNTQSFIKTAKKIQFMGFVAYDASNAKNEQQNQIWLSNNYSNQWIVYEDIDERRTAKRLKEEKINATEFFATAAQ